MIKEYKYNDKTQLTKNVNVSELKCKGTGHTHNIKVDIDHVNHLQDFMNKNDLNKIVFSSGYRCSIHDKKVGGSGYGQHTKGTATDVCFYKDGKIVPAQEICCLAQDYGFNGIAYINKNYVHLDNRTTRKYRGDERYGRTNNVPNGDFYKYFGIERTKKHYEGTYPTLPNRGYFKKGDRGAEVKNLQSLLNWILGTKLVTDGILGDKTINAVKMYQKQYNLKADGLFGKASLEKAKTIEK